MRDTHPAIFLATALHVLLHRHSSSGYQPATQNTIAYEWHVCKRETTPCNISSCWITWIALKIEKSENSFRVRWIEIQLFFCYRLLLYLRGYCDHHCTHFITTACGFGTLAGNLCVNEKLVPCSHCVKKKITYTDTFTAYLLKSKEMRIVTQKARTCTFKVALRQILNEFQWLLVARGLRNEIEMRMERMVIVEYRVLIRSEWLVL